MPNNFYENNVLSTIARVTFRIFSGIFNFSGKTELDNALHLRTGRIKLLENISSTERLFSKTGMLLSLDSILTISAHKELAIKQ